MNSRIKVDLKQITAFCQKWRITEFALFGSVLSNDFKSDSDVDILVTFAQDAPWDYFDWAEMTTELNSIFKHKIDLVEKDGLRNPYRRQAILNTRQVLYAA